MALGRRRFLLLGAAVLAAPVGAHAQAAIDREHRITLDVPALSEDPTGVPVALAIDHPMDRDHYIKSVEISLPNDPIPYKGTFFFTPANGRAAVAFKMRSGAGGTVRAVADCSRHGRFTGARDIRVAEGGCAMPAERGAHDRPHNVQIRLPDSMRAGDTIEARVRVEHLTETGLTFRGGRYVREAPEFYLKEMLVFFDDEKISAFRMSAAISPNPIIRFRVRVLRAGTLKVVFVNSEGQRGEASQRLTL